MRAMTCRADPHFFPLNAWRNPWPPVWLLALSAAHCGYASCSPESLPFCPSGRVRAPRPAGGRPHHSAHVRRTEQRSSNRTHTHARSTHTHAEAEAAMQSAMLQQPTVRASRTCARAQQRAACFRLSSGASPCHAHHAVQQLRCARSPLGVTSAHQRARPAAPAQAAAGAYGDSGADPQSEVQKHSLSAVLLAVAAACAGAFGESSPGFDLTHLAKRARAGTHSNSSTRKRYSLVTWIAKMRAGDAPPHDAHALLVPRTRCSVRVPRGGGQRAPGGHRGGPRLRRQQGHAGHGRLQHAGGRRALQPHRCALLLPRRTP